MKCHASVMHVKVFADILHNMVNEGPKANRVEIFWLWCHIKYTWKMDIAQKIILRDLLPKNGWKIFLCEDNVGVFMHLKIECRSSPIK